MKRVFVILMVLSMAAMANAGFSPATTVTLSGSNAPGSGSVSVYVVPNATDQADEYMAITIPGSITSALGPAAPADSADMGSMADAGLDALCGNGEIWAMISYVSVYPKGVWLTASLTGIDYMNGTKIEVWESIDASFTDLNPNMRGQIMLIPEPMTMCLLGLGGLFLRRRK